MPRKRGRARRLRITPRAWIALALVAVVCMLPPGRRVVAGAARAVRHAVAQARAAEARERTVARYARRYGIRREMADAIERASRAEGVDVDVAFRLVRVESAFHERAVSGVGAIGLTQLMPATAAELQPGITRERLFDRDTNLRLGFRYFARLLRIYDQDVPLALHAYNRGIGTVARIRAAGGDPANGYARKVLGGPGASPVNQVPVGPPLPPKAPGRVDELAPVRLPGARE